MNDSYNHVNDTAFTKEQCREAVGKRASLTLTGEIVDFYVSAAGPFVRFRPDERWGLDVTLGMDLDVFDVEASDG